MLSTSFWRQTTEEISKCNFTGLWDPNQAAEAHCQKSWSHIWLPTSSSSYNSLWQNIPCNPKPNLMILSCSYLDWEIPWLSFTAFMGKCLRNIGQGTVVTFYKKGIYLVTWLSPSQGSSKSGCPLILLGKVVTWHFSETTTKWPRKAGREELGLFHFPLPVVCNKLKCLKVAAV